MVLAGLKFLLCEAKQAGLECDDSLLESVIVDPMGQETVPKCSWSQTIATEGSFNEDGAESFVAGYCREANWNRKYCRFRSEAA